MINDVRLWWTVIGMAAVLCAGGCSKPKFYPTRGQVIVFGVGPLKEGEVRIRPNSKPTLIATGKIKKDGTFTATTEGHGEGVLEGDCKVAIVVEPKGGKRLIAERYADFETAELNYTIGPRVENWLQLEAKKGGN